MQKNLVANTNKHTYGDTTIEWGKPSAQHPVVMPCRVKQRRVCLDNGTTYTHGTGKAGFTTLNYRVFVESQIGNVCDSRIHKYLYT